MIDLWNKTSKENHAICYGYAAKTNENDFKNYSKAKVMFRAREVRNRQNLEYKINDTYLADKQLMFLETGDQLDGLKKNDIVIYAGRKLIIEETSVKIDNPQITFAYFKPSAVTLLICRGNV